MERLKILDSKDILSEPMWITKSLKELDSVFQPIILKLRLTEDLQEIRITPERVLVII